jgi:hypothetical protein
MATTASPPTGGISIRVRSYNNVIIRNNVIGYNAVGDWTKAYGEDGIDVFHSSEVLVSGNQIQYVQDGVACDWGDSCVVSDNVVENFKGYGIRSERTSNNSSATAITHLVIANNVVNASTAVSNAPVSAAGIKAASGAPETGTAGAPTSIHVSVSDNTVKGPYSVAGIICSASNGACSGNSVDCASPTGGAQVGIAVIGSYLSVTGNEIFDSNAAVAGAPIGSSSGIELLPDPKSTVTSVTGTVIAGNAIYYMAYGININNIEIINVTITNNNLAGNAQGILLASSATFLTSRIVVLPVPDTERMACTGGHKAA